MKTQNLKGRFTFFSEISCGEVFVKKGTNRFIIRIPCLTAAFGQTYNGILLDSGIPIAVTEEQECIVYDNVKLILD